jgi:lysyl-tRNA synthetase, class I
MSKTNTTFRTLDGKLVRRRPDGSEEIVPMKPPAEMSNAEVEQAAERDADSRPLSRDDLRTLKRVPRYKTLRRALGLTQDEFAARFQIPIGTLRDWEQGRSQPDKAAEAYLKAICRDPEGVQHALHGDAKFSDELLTVPSAIQEVLKKLEQSKEIFDIETVRSTLDEARRKLKDLPEGAQFGAWAEVAAFSVMHGLTTKPWGTYFGPMFTMEASDGRLLHGPDIPSAHAAVVAYWASRARSTPHPVLMARYADLVWDFGRLITGQKSDVQMARMAIGAYLDTLQEAKPTRQDFAIAARACDIAIQINDLERIEYARALILKLHNKEMAQHGTSWMAFDYLVSRRQSGLTDVERQGLINDLERAIVERADTDSPFFDHHEVASAAERLIKHYTRLGRLKDVQPIHALWASAFEHSAKNSTSALLAAHEVRVSADHYKLAGLYPDEERMRLLLQDKIRASRSEMKTVGATIDTPKEDVEKFLQGVVVEDRWQTLFNIAAGFIPDKNAIEQQIKDLAEKAPLMSRIPLSIISEDRVTAKIGSVEEDPFGRIIHQTKFHLDLSTRWLNWALNRAFERHDYKVEHLVAWINRFQLYEDVTLLHEGVSAWQDGDLVKSLHVLMPQVEHGLRSIVHKLGKPTTKPHKLQGLSLALNMGDILYDDEITSKFGANGPNLALYLQTLYVDPRGFNLRNEVAHGLLRSQEIHPGLLLWVMHTLLVYGGWKASASEKRAES